MCACMGRVLVIKFSFGEQLGMRIGRFAGQFLARFIRNFELKLKLSRAVCACIKIVGKKIKI